MPVNAFSAAAAEDRAMLDHFSPEERVARRFPDLPRIEHRAQARAARFYAKAPSLLLRSCRIKEYRVAGVFYPIAVEAALEAEKRPTLAELQAWRASR